MELRISDGERDRYTEIYGTDPLARDGWVTLRLKRRLEILGCVLGSEFDLLGLEEGETIEAPTTTGRAIAQVGKRREEDTSVFSVIVRW